MVKPQITLNNTRSGNYWVPISHINMFWRSKPIKLTEEQVEPLEIPLLSHHLSDHKMNN